MLQNTFDAKEDSFLENFSAIHKEKLSPDANIVNSHFFNKVKQNGDGSLILKARTATHENEDDMRSMTASDGTKCLPTGLGMLESMLSLKKLVLYKAYVKKSFLKPDKATIRVFVNLPKEIKMS